MPWAVWHGTAWHLGSHLQVSFFCVEVDAVEQVGLLLGAERGEELAGEDGGVAGWGAGDEERHLRVRAREPH